MTEKPRWADPTILEWVQFLLNSYRHWTGQELIERQGSLAQEGERLFSAPFAVVSHGIEEDPVLNYGNLIALRLWEMEWPEFTRTPSRLTTEPMNWMERESMLHRAATEGFIPDYKGVRITRSGRRFLVERATVWNVMDHHQNRLGQAATFSTWRVLHPPEGKG